jgi:hypothetical protein
VRVRSCDNEVARGLHRVVDPMPPVPPGPEESAGADIGQEAHGLPVDAPAGGAVLRIVPSAEDGSAPDERPPSVSPTSEAWGPYYAAAERAALAAQTERDRRWGSGRTFERAMLFVVALVVTAALALKLWR